jgi:hypothetical protein
VQWLRGRRTTAAAGAPADILSAFPQAVPGLSSADALNVVEAMMSVLAINTAALQDVLPSGDIDVLTDGIQRLWPRAE